MCTDDRGDKGFQRKHFSDLNNLRVITTTSDLYADCFGFTEKEVFDALDNYGMGDKKEIVKQWYDGFTFGQYHDIYNPWSITNYLKEKSYIHIGHLQALMAW